MVGVFPRGVNRKEWPRSFQPWAKETVLDQYLVLCPPPGLVCGAALASSVAARLSVAGSVLPCGFPRKSSDSLAPFPLRSLALLGKIPPQPAPLASASAAALLGRGWRAPARDKALRVPAAPARRQAEKALLDFTPHVRVGRSTRLVPPRPESKACPCSQVFAVYRKFFSFCQAPTTAYYRSWGLMLLYPSSGT